MNKYPYCSKGEWNRSEEWIADIRARQDRLLREVGV